MGEEGKEGRVDSREYRMQKEWQSGRDGGRKKRRMGRYQGVQKAERMADREGWEKG